MRVCVVTSADSFSDARIGELQRRAEKGEAKVLVCADAFDEMPTELQARIAPLGTLISTEL